MKNALTRIGMVVVMPLLAAVFCARVCGAMIGLIAGLASPARRGRRMGQG